jgi:hypothetical protein
VPSQVQNGYCHVEMTWSVGGQTRSSVITTDCVMPATVPLPTALSAVVGAFIQPTAVMAINAVSANATLVKSSILARVGGMLYSYANNTPTPGTNLGIAALPPPNVTITMAKQTAFAGRDMRGHTSLPEYTIDASLLSDSGFLTTGQLATLQSGADATYAFLVTSGFIPVLNHTATVSNPHPVPTPIDDFLIRPVVGTDRRRVRQ